MILQTLYTIRRKRLLMEEIDFNLAYRWFVGLGLDEPMWVATVFTKNRERLLESDIARCFFEDIRRRIDESGIASDEHFSMDGTQLEVWASMKSFQLKGKEEEPSDKSDDDPGNPTVDFKGEKLCNDTHQSKTDPDCRLNRKPKWKEAKLAYFGNLLIENRNGLMLQAEVLRASGTAEEEAALSMLDRERKWQKAKRKRMTVGVDKKNDSKGFVQAVRKRLVIPHVTKREDRLSAIDERTTRHLGYLVN